MAPCYAFYSTDRGSKLSSAIREIGDGRISHAGIVYWRAEFAQWQVIDCIESGWVERSYHQFKAQGNEIVELHDFSPLDLWQGVHANRDLLGVPYDWGGVLVGRLVLKWWWAVTGRAIKKNHWNHPARFYCNEILAARVFPAAGIHLGLGDRVDMDPFQLAAICRNANLVSLRNPKILDYPPEV